MKPWLKIVLQIAAAVAIIAVLFRFGRLFGLAGVAAVIFILCYRFRPGYYALQAKIRYSKQDLKGSADLFGKAYRYGRKPAHAISQTFLQLKLGCPKEAERLLLQVMQKPLSRTEEMNAKLYYSLNLWMLGRTEQAVELMEQLLPAYKNSNVYGYLGMFYVLQNDLSKALAFNLEAYEYNNSDKAILDNLALTYHLLGRHQEAKEIYEKLMALSPSFAEAYYYYSMTLWQLNERKQAVQVLQQGLQYDPSMMNTVTREMMTDKLREWQSQTA